jgi:RHS repeat-associated protein
MMLNDNWGAAQPDGRLSSAAVDNVIGYAGYIFNAELPGAGVYTVRHRHYDPDLGRWIQRDPLGYVDGMGLYEYVRGAPMSLIDPLGAHATAGYPPCPPVINVGMMICWNVAQGEDGSCFYMCPNGTVHIRNPGVRPPSWPPDHPNPIPFPPPVQPAPCPVPPEPPPFRPWPKPELPEIPVPPLPPIVPIQPITPPPVAPPARPWWPPRLPSLPRLPAIPVPSLPIIPEIPLWPLLPPWERPGYYEDPYNPHRMPVV